MAVHPSRLARHALTVVSALVALVAALRMPALPPAGDGADRDRASRIETLLEAGDADPGEEFKEAREGEGEDESSRPFADAAPLPPPPKYHDTHVVRACAHTPPDLSASALPLRAPPAPRTGA